MDLTQLANLGEFVGGVAVLVMLIYLAVQVREGRRDLRLHSELALNDRLAGAASQYAITPDLSRALELAYEAPDSLDDDETRSAVWAMVSFLRGVDAMYRRYIEGLISAGAWIPQERILDGTLESPFVRRLWATKQNLAYSDQFRSFVDGKLAWSGSGDRWEVVTRSRLQSE